MSPYHFSGSARVFYVYGSGAYLGWLWYGHVVHSRGVRPVLSLKSCVEVTGKGTVDAPYEVLEISNECALADN